MYISPEQAEQVFNTRPPYATVESFKSILSRTVYVRYEPDNLLIDTPIKLPVDKQTTFPYWVILYTHRHKDKAIEESNLLVEAIQLGYRKNDIRKVKSFLEDTQANIGIWYDSKEGKTYYRWYEPDDLIKKVQSCLDGVLQ